MNPLEMVLRKHVNDPRYQDLLDTARSTGITLTLPTLEKAYRDAGRSLDRAEEPSDVFDRMAVRDGFEGALLERK